MLRLKGAFQWDKDRKGYSFISFGCVANVSEEAGEEEVVENTDMVWLTCLIEYGVTLT